MTVIEEMIDRIGIGLLVMVLVGLYGGHIGDRPVWKSTAEERGNGVCLEKRLGRDRDDVKIVALKGLRLRCTAG